MDAVPEETGGETEPFNINRNTFDMNASVTPFKYGAIRFGYGLGPVRTLDSGDREGWQDKTARVSFDTIGNGYVTLRAMYEHSKRTAIDTDVAEIIGGGGQPALRFYDEGVAQA